MATLSSWSRDQLLIALTLYCQLPFGRMHASNPLIIEFAERIHRTPSALAMKLTNFASLDPEVTSRGRKGLANASSADKALWEEMHADWQGFAVESERAVGTQNRGDRFEPATEVPELDDYEGTERTAETPVRVGQQFFRRAVLSAHNYQCCITGLATPTLLLASHIVPWRSDAANRLNPRNGLCLTALHDRAFDAGIITIAENMTLTVSGAAATEGDRFFEAAILAFSGKAITLPEKFRPAPEFLNYHREHVFRG